MNITEFVYRSSPINYQLNNKVMDTVEFVYSPLHRVRFIIADNNGYKYKDTGDNVEAGTLIYEGRKIAFADFLDWIRTPGHYLHDAVDDRVIKVYNGGDDIMYVCCADGFFDEQYMPWDEFEKYDTVIVVGNKFIMINVDGEEMEFTALAPSVPII